MEHVADNSRIVKEIFCFCQFEILSFCSQEEVQNRPRLTPQPISVRYRSSTYANVAQVATAFEVCQQKFYMNLILPICASCSTHLFFLDFR